MIKPLTSLRFAFALMVFASHLSFLDQSPNGSIRLVYLSVFKEGYIGVSFFFILSGFILAYNYGARIRGSIAEIGSFLTARFARIYPLHILTMLLAIPLSHQAGLCCFEEAGSFVANLATNVLLIHGFFPGIGECCYLNGPSWSISLEMFFYVLFPLLIYILNKGLARLSVQIFSVILLGTTIYLMMKTVPVLVLNERFYYLNPLVRSADFLLGMVLFVVFDKLRRADLKMNHTFIELLAVIVFVGFFAFHASVPQVYRYSVYYWGPISLLILALAFQRGVVSRMLSANWLLILGEISFAFYMFHQLVLRYLSVLYPSGMMTEMNRTMLSLVISLAISYVSHRLFEVPVGRFLKRTVNLSRPAKAYSFLIERKGSK